MFTIILKNILNKTLIASFMLIIVNSAITISYAYDIKDYNYFHKNSSIKLKSSTSNNPLRASVYRNYPVKGNYQTEVKVNFYNNIYDQQGKSFEVIELELPVYSVDSVIKVSISTLDVELLSFKQKMKDVIYNHSTAYYQSTTGLIIIRYNKKEHSIYIYSVENPKHYSVIPQINIRSFYYWIFGEYL